MKNTPAGDFPVNSGVDVMLWLRQLLHLQFAILVGVKPDQIRFHEVHEFGFW
ncbi:MAG TPA: hypothetical protein VK789_00030 [Bryobacteraceae bacterium]|nr:hypothetical protein [Bryobacteraceae bacterium]